MQRKAFDWFLGENDLHLPVYDFRTKGSADGLEQNGLNLNQGAESLLSFLLSLLCIVESYGTVRKPLPEKEPKSTDEDSAAVTKRLPISELALKSGNAGKKSGKFA